MGSTSMCLVVIASRAQHTHAHTQVLCACFETTTNHFTKTFRILLSSKQKNILLYRHEYIITIITSGDHIYEHWHTDKREKLHIATWQQNKELSCTLIMTCTTLQLVYNMWWSQKRKVGVPISLPVPLTPSQEKAKTRTCGAFWNRHLEEERKSSLVGFSEQCETSVYTWQHQKQAAELHHSLVPTIPAILEDNYSMLHYSACVNTAG